MSLQNRRSIVVVAFLLATPLAHAGSAPAPNPVPDESRPASEQDLLGGVITSRTITVLGWDFYEYFTAKWQAIHGNERLSLSIYERPTARWGSEIWIDYRQTRVFHTFLPPARSATKEISTKAVDFVYKNVTDINIQRSLFTDVDLAPEEM
ncbi:MAG TPA: curli production assembly/transport protein CsgE [Paralcaligenes sp.]